jgi:hypothetical protein
VTDDAESEGLPSPEPGFEVIDLDLSKVPTVERGIAAARERYTTFIAIAKEALGDSGDEVLLINHLPFMAFVNRACSLHRGIILAVQDENPHSAFTLLRAYLELVVTVLYIDSHPDYLRDLERPIDQGGKRKRFKELFEFAARELRGVRTAYAHLSEMGHFGSTAMWMPFSVGDDDDEDSRRFSFGTGPHWKKPDDPKIALTGTCDECGVTKGIAQPCDCGAWAGRDDVHVMARRALVQPIRDNLDREIAPAEALDFSEALDVLVPWIESFFGGLNQVGGETPDASSLAVTTEAILSLRDRVQAVPRRRPWLAVWDPFRSLVAELIGLAKAELEACMAPDPDAARTFEAAGQQRIDAARDFIHTVDIHLMWWGIERTIRLPHSAIAAAAAAYEDTGAESILALDRLGMARYQRITGKDVGPTGIGVGLSLDFGLIDRAFDEIRFFHVAATAYARLNKFRPGLLELMDDSGWRADLLEARRKFYDAQLKAETIVKHLAGERRLEAGAVIELGGAVTEVVAPVLLGLLVGAQRSRKVARGRDYTNYLQMARQAELDDVLAGFDESIRNASAHGDLEVADDHLFLGKNRTRVDDEDLVDRVLTGLESAAAMFAALDCMLTESSHPSTGDRLADFSADDPLWILLGASGVEPTRIEHRGDRLEISTRSSSSLQVTPMMIVATVTPHVDPGVRRLTLRMKRPDATLVTDVPLDAMRRFQTEEGLARDAGLIECLGRSSVNGRPVMPRGYTRFLLAIRVLDFLEAPLEEAENAGSVLGATARRLGDRDLAESVEAFRAGRRAQEIGLPWRPEDRRVYERLAMYIRSKPPGPWDGGAMLRA